MKTKIKIHFIVSTLLSLCLAPFFWGCSNDDDPNPDPSGSFEQYTPDQANWETFYTKSSNAGNTSHDPDGISWLSPESWEAAAWDGTIYDPTTKTREEFASCLCPNGDQVRGIRKVFYEHNPFEDNANPTKAEVDEWHRIAINHLRALVGYNSEERKVKKDHCLFARALWGDELKFTRMWDDAYGITCLGDTNQHCGAAFILNPTDQEAYLPEGYPYCGIVSGAEGVSNASKSDIPWSIKWSRAFCSFLRTEGFWGGHVGPWFHREKFGFSFWDYNPSNQASNAILRAKWSGTLMPSLYENPNP